MIKEFTIEGIENANKCFDNLETELLNSREPLSKSAGFMKEEALRNFPAEGGVFEENWPPLKPSTIRRKEKAGYGDQPMMVRTGRLKNSFIAEEPKVSAGIGKVDVMNPVPYAKSHQSGVGRLPRRVLLKFAKRQVDTITKTFFDWVVDKTEKSFNS